MFASVGSCAVPKPSPPPMLNQNMLVRPPRRFDVAHHEPLSCSPPQTRYGICMSNDTL